jgi:hypothetical protein
LAEAVEAAWERKKVEKGLEEWVKKRVCFGIAAAGVEGWVKQIA